MAEQSDRSTYKQLKRQPNGFFINLKYYYIFFNNIGFVFIFNDKWTLSKRIFCALYWCVLAVFHMTFSLKMRYCYIY